MAVLDQLGWDSAYLMGHSWGGHLALHAANAIPDRLSGVLAIDPLGAVGDGGAAEFMAGLVARMPNANRPGFDELTAKESTGGLSVEEDVEQLRLVAVLPCGAGEGTHDAPCADVAAGARRSVSRSQRAPAGAGGRTSLYQGAGRRACRRTQPHPDQSWDPHCRSHPRGVVACRTRSRSLHLIRGSGRGPDSDGPAYRAFQRPVAIGRTHSMVVAAWTK